MNTYTKCNIYNNLTDLEKQEIVGLISGNKSKGTIVFSSGKKLNVRQLG